MHPIPLKLRKDMASDPYYEICCRLSGQCAGRITYEHAWDYAGRQIQEKWAIIPLCEYHHLGAGLDKDKNRLIALSRATENDLNKYPKRDWRQEKIRLISKDWRCSKGDNILK